ncbi:hypothetical protein HX021_18885 [Sphingobacterium sp. N143]|uniref:hypothetical protein n=1 Tax=Sphingobacterium sp. N143 TaxID=2746727 RepID=UPI002577A8A4|nr:hypothetical protein [Sphingobacterium sp. N143]MDM1296355.1 hypothetical protein [Sphingobacterium sp. N143]
MKKFTLIMAASLTLLTAGVNEVKAQRGDDDKRWERRREANKKRDEYIRESEKKRDEYYRERDKKEAEYYRESAKRRKEYQKERRKHGIPAWARAHRYDARHHVYFEDYRTFYDPYRGGYVYLDAGNWRFSVDIPSFMINVDLGRANMRVINDVPISRHPEDFYDDYDDDYWDQD